MKITFLQMLPKFNRKLEKDYEAQLHLQETKNCALSWWETFVAFNQEWLLGVRLRILTFGQLATFPLILYAGHSGEYGNKRHLGT